MINIFFLDSMTHNAKNLPVQGRSKSFQWRGWDLNPRHKAYESSALPTELPRQYFKPKNGTMPDQFCQLFSLKYLYERSPCLVGEP